MMTKDKAKLLKERLQAGKPVVVYVAYTEYDDDMVLKVAAVEAATVTTFEDGNLHFTDSEGVCGVVPYSWFHSTYEQALVDLEAKITAYEKRLEERLAKVAVRKKVLTAQKEDLALIREKLKGGAQ